MDRIYLVVSQTARSEPYKIYLLTSRHYQMIGLVCKQKCNNFGYLSNEVQSKGNDRSGGSLHGRCNWGSSNSRHRHF